MWLALLPASAPAQAQSAPDKGAAFVPTPISKPLYGSKPPEEDPETQRAFIEGHDGTQLYIETWLPEKNGNNTPPKKVPTVMVMTPYAALGTSTSLIEHFNARGFAVAYAHVRGTGNSGGCLEQTSTDQMKDGANFVEYLGKEAPWTNGKVGMYGASYDAETQISTAAFGNPKKIKYLKAIIPTASVGSQYDWNFMDGVPWTGQPSQGNAAYLAISFLPDPGNPQPNPTVVTRPECQGEVMAENANYTGDYTEYWQLREYRIRAHKVKAATLMVHGLRDFNVQPITLAGFFDNLPDTTPHKGLFGVWEHAYPSSHGVASQWNRADWMDMATAWFDRYLKGLDTNVEQWPDVQVQGSDGQWWAVDEYPTTGGPLGQLALSAGGGFGAAKPKGSSTFTETMNPGVNEEGQYLVYETPKLKAPLHVTGQPMLDIYVSSSTEDGHVGAELEVIDANGQPMSNGGGALQATYGVRSLQHIEPMRRGWFEQEAGEPLSPGEVYRVTIRFLPTDLVVPKGGSLRITISGSISYNKGDSLPSMAGSEITILHNCNNPSALRFRMPDPNAKLLNVREQDELGTDLADTRAEMGRMDGGGIATQRVCGARPRALPFL